MERKSVPSHASLLDHPSAARRRQEPVAGGHARCFLRKRIVKDFLTGVGGKWATAGRPACRLRIGYPGAAHSESRSSGTRPSPSFPPDAPMQAHDQPYRQGTNTAAEQQRPGQREEPEPLQRKPTTSPTSPPIRQEMVQRTSSRANTRISLNPCMT